jgi:DNA-binding CsgD family transcriptional regulator
VRPLSVGALHHVIRTRLGFSLPRPSLLRVYEHSGGNPLYALELASAVQEHERLGGVETLGLPTTLLELVRDRLDRLPEGVLETLALAALLPNPPQSLLAASGGGAETIELAIREGVLKLQGETVRFTHPLLAAASLSRIDPPRVRALHRRLADLVETEDARAHHLALGAEEPSQATAEAIEAAAGRAAARGAPAAAAELAEHAARLTPSEAPDERDRRLLAAAWYHVVAGSSERGWSMLERLLETLPAGLLRAEALVFALERPGPIEQRFVLLEEAAAQSEGDEALLGRIERERSEALMLTGRLDEALAAARSAAARAERAGDPALLVQCLGTLAHFETYAADITPGLLERGVELEAATAGASSHYSPAQILGLRLLYADRLDEGRELIERVLAQTREDGYEAERLNVLVHLAQLEVRAGDWALADEHAGEAEMLADQLQRQPANAAFARALVDAHRGRVDSARTAAELGLRHADAKGDRLFSLLNRWALGFLQLSLDEVEQAVATLGPLPAELEAMGYRHPGVRPVAPDAIEALIRVGALDRVPALLDGHAARGASLDNPWVLATAARGRGLLAAAEGRLEAALTALTEALVEHERAASPFERARTLLALGSAQRRAKQKKTSRQSLESALAEFERLGAPLWAAKARSELARIGGRRAATQELTASERRVAELVAEGKSNPEVAATLFITRQTVEKHLSRIYAKLGVRSRTELARRFANADDAGAPE